MATYPKGTTLIELPHSNMIWPRQTLRDQVAGGAGVAWIEIIACTMRNAGETNVLQAHLDYILTDRKRRQQEIAKQREINRLMMQGDSHAVDGIVRRSPDAGDPNDTGPEPAQ